MAKPKTKEQSAATLTIFDGPRMTADGRRSIAAWLQRQARALVKDGGKYCNRFTARYLY